MAHSPMPFKKLFPRAFALFLILSLTLPSPAHALRKQQAADSPPAAAQLAAGMEQNGPVQARIVSVNNGGAWLEPQNGSGKRRFLPLSMVFEDPGRLLCMEAKQAWLRAREREGTEFLASPVESSSRSGEPETVFRLSIQATPALFEEEEVFHAQLLSLNGKGEIGKFLSWLETQGINPTEGLIQLYYLNPWDRLTLGQKMEILRWLADHPDEDYGKGLFLLFHDFEASTSKRTEWFDSHIAALEGLSNTARFLPPEEVLEAVQGLWAPIDEKWKDAFRDDGLRLLGGIVQRLRTPEADRWLAQVSNAGMEAERLEYRFGSIPETIQGREGRLLLMDGKPRFFRPSEDELFQVTEDSTETYVLSPVADSFLAEAVATLSFLVGGIHRRFMPPLTIDASNDATIITLNPTMHVQARYLPDAVEVSINGHPPLRIDRKDALKISWADGQPADAEAQSAAYLSVFYGLVLDDTIRPNLNRLTTGGTMFHLTPSQLRAPAAGMEQVKRFESIRDFMRAYKGELRSGGLFNQVVELRKRKLPAQVWVIPRQTVARKTVRVYVAAEAAGEQNVWELAVQERLNRERDRLPEVLFIVEPYPGDGKLKEDLPAVVIRQTGAGPLNPTPPVPVVGLSILDEVEKLVPSWIYALAVNRALDGLRVGPVLDVIEVSDGYAIFV